jgi:hypothetical protein
MGKRIQLEPGWLVSLLNQWAVHDLRSQTGGLGYASGSSWMRGLKSSPASSIDPTGYAARDFRDVDGAMNELRITNRNHWAAVSMYYKPWVVENFKTEGFPFGNRLYFDRLQRAHKLLSEHMELVKASREILLKRAA